MSRAVEAQQEGRSHKTGRSEEDHRTLHGVLLAAQTVAESQLKTLMSLACPGKHKCPLI